MKNALSELPQNLVQLARGYRRAVRGEGTWTVEALGVLKGVIRDEQNWRPDFMHRAHVTLCRCLEAAERAIMRFDSAAERSKLEEAMKAVRAYWGIDRYPLEPAEALGAARSDTPSALRQRLSDRQLKVCAVGIAGGMLDHGIDLDVSPPATLLRREARTSAGLPLWDLDSPTTWPPQHSEREWLIREVIAYAGIERIPGSGEHAPDQALQLLRRRVEEQLLAYLHVEPTAGEASRHATTVRLQHLTHRITPAWFDQDKLDLRSGVAHAGAVVRDDEESAQRIVLRSQAALSSLFFYRVVEMWDDAAMSRILRERKSVRAAYPITLPSLPMGTAPAEFKAHQPQDGPAYVQASRSHAARSIFQQMLDIRQGAGATDIATYVNNRREIDKNWSSLDLHSRRTVLLADHGVHLYAAGKVGPALMDDLDEMLAKSSEARREYVAFLRRDRSIDVGKSNTLRGLQASLVFLYEARSELAHAVLDDGTLRHDMQVALETRHQLDLATAGATVKVLEKLMSSSALQLPHRVNDAMVRRVRAPVRWADSAFEALSNLDRMGALVESRYQEGYLADASWHVQTRVIRLRCLCAEYTMTRALGLPQESRSPSSEDIDVAYRDLMITPQLRPGNVPLALQLAMWVAFLRGNSLPHVGAQMSVSMRHIAEIGQFDARGNARVAIEDDAYQKLSTKIAGYGFDFGALEIVDPASPVGRLLDGHSAGAFGRWSAWVRGTRPAAEQPMSSSR